MHDVVRTLDRHDSRERWRSKIGYGQTLQFAALDRCCDLISRLSDDIRDQNSTDDWIRVLKQCDPDSLALTTLDTLIASIIRQHGGKKAAIRLGRAAHGEAWAAKLLIDDKALHRKISKSDDPRKHAIKAGYRSKEWSEEQAFRVGNWLIDCCLRALPEIFVERRGPRGEVIIDIAEQAKELADQLTKILIGCNPVLVPSISPPKPWTDWRDGGYHDERARASVTFVKGKAARNKDTEQAFQAAFRNGSMKQHVDAVNSLQSVPYRINKPVLEALRRYGPRTKSGHDLLQLERDIAIADRLNGAFYIPLNTDFRGRIYPIPYFNYQRDDSIRALFLLDQGEPITERGLERLKDYVASRWGLDKAILPTRRQWCDDNRDLIEKTAGLESEDWLNADKPFAFLAACIELVEAAKVGPGYITRLPLAYDGNCNGLMHFCALTRQDPLGMMAECATAETTIDPYEFIAGKAQSVLEEHWPQLQVNRGFVKSPTQTFFYGVSKIGMARQLREVLKDRGIKLDDPADVYRMGEEVRKIIEGVIPGAAETMGFLQQLAEGLACHGLVLQCTTLTGLPWANRYHKYKTKRIRSLLSGVSIRPKITDGYEPGIRVKKSKDAAAANFIHALDASHLVLTVNECVRVNMPDVMAIHDSYSCLAPRADQLNNIIREQFAAMYEQHDPLTQVRESALRTLADAPPKPAKRVADAVGVQPFSFPDVPKRGDLDLREFIKNVYAFS
jgi:Autographiviridae RNA polymerase